MIKSEQKYDKNSIKLSKLCYRIAGNKQNGGNKSSNRDKQTTQKQSGNAQKVIQQRFPIENNLNRFRVQQNQFKKGKQFHDRNDCDDVQNIISQIENHDIENKKPQNQQQKHIGEDLNHIVQVNADYKPEDRWEPFSTMDISFINNLQQASQVSREQLREIIGILSEGDSNFVQDLARLKDPHLTANERERIQQDICKMIEKFIQRANEQTRINQMKTIHHNVKPILTLGDIGLDNHPILRKQSEMMLGRIIYQFSKLPPEEREKNFLKPFIDKISHQGTTDVQTGTTTKSIKIITEKFKQQIATSFKKGIGSTALNYGIKTGIDVLIRKKNLKQSTKDNLKQSSTQLVGLLAGKAVSLLMPRFGNQVGQIISQAIPFFSNKQTSTKIKEACQKRFKRNQNNK